MLTTRVIGENSSKEKLFYANNRDDSLSRGCLP
jgi:hypothetical protein